MDDIKTIAWMLLQLRKLKYCLALVCFLINLTVHASEYVYDELGRLIAVRSSEGVATYQYDAVGNLLETTTLPSSELVLHYFTPQSGSVGSQVTLFGNFSGISTPGVSINGVIAPVTSATLTQITVIVPAGATSGAITVMSGGGSVTSLDTFIVEPTDGVPMVSAVAPNCLIVGQMFTIDGANFDLRPGATRVQIGEQIVQATVDTENQISAITPPNVLGGRVSVFTNQGYGESVETVTVGAQVNSCNSFSDTTWIDIDTDIAINIPRIKRHFLYFQSDGTEWLSFQVSGASADAETLGLNMGLYHPNGDLIYNKSLSRNGYTGSLPKLTYPGTYMLQLSTSSNDAIFNARLESPISIPLNGSPTTVVASKAQDKRINIPANVDEVFSIGMGSQQMVGVTSGSSHLHLIGPDGRIVPGGLDGSLSNCNISQAVAQCGQSFSTAFSTGDYVLEWQTNNSADHSSAQLWMSTDFGSHLMPNQAVRMNIERPGQSGGYVFSAEAGQSFSISVSDLSLTSSIDRLNIYLYSPRGELVSSAGVSSTSLTFRTPGDIATYQNLPESGDYLIRMVPYGSGLAEAEIVLEPGIELSPSPVGVNSVHAGRSIRFIVDAQVGQAYGIGLTNISIEGANNSRLIVRGYTPDGQALAFTHGSQHSCYPTDLPGREPACELDLSPSLVAGRYVLIVEPSTSSVTNYEYEIRSTPDLGSAINGALSTKTISNYGQNGRFAFQGEPGAGKTILIADVETDPVNKRVFGEIIAPDGLPLSGSPLLRPRTSLGTDHQFSIGDFPVRGTYTLFIDPDYGSLASVEVYQQAGALDLVSQIPQSFPVIPGPWRRIEFSGAAGDRVSFFIDNVAFVDDRATRGRAIQMVVLDPDNQRLINNNGVHSFQSCSHTLHRCDFDLPQLTKSGDYQAVAYLPVKDATEIVSSNAVIRHGEVISGRSGSFSLLPGMNGYLDFIAVAGETPRVNIERTSETGSQRAVKFRVLSPLGDELSTFTLTRSRTILSQALPVLSAGGIYSLEIDPDHGYSASINVSVE